MELIEKLIQILEEEKELKLSLHFIKRMANKVIEENKYCICKNREDQHKSDNIWICGDCDKEIKQNKL